MTQPRQPRRAAVLAAALNSWATTTRDGTDPVARLELRQGPDWTYAGKTPLTDTQVTRILHMLRDDLIPAQPNTPTQAAAAVDQILAEWRAEGRTRIRPADLIEQLPRIAQTRAWLATHLVHLVDDGYLHETRRPGTYRL
ncbi:hypothetical protein [Streptomyces sp.]|uniref:hypothetical protein n=1 Tax=Streptomyces sp. TaxID=1931 RepID=UPI002F3FD11B